MLILWLLPMTLSLTGQTTRAERKEQRGFSKLVPIQIGFFYGPSVKLQRLDKGLEEPFLEYEKDLRTGSHFGIDFHAVFREKVGLGVKFSVYNTKATLSEDAVFFDSYGRPYTRSGVGEHTNVTFIAPSVLLLSEEGLRNFRFTTLVSIGAVLLARDYNVPYEVRLDGKGFGAQIDFRLDYSISRFLVVRLYGGIFAASMNAESIEISSARQGAIDANEAQRLERFDTGLGFTMRF